MEFHSPPGDCNYRLSEHSGASFDWWRISSGGMIVQPSPRPPVPPPFRHFPLKKSELCWPLVKGARNKPESVCEISMNFWPDKLDRAHKGVRHKDQCVPWKPAKLSNQFGVIKYPPPYTRYCRDREKLMNFVCKP